MTAQCRRNDFTILFSDVYCMPHAGARPKCLDPGTLLQRQNSSVLNVSAPCNAATTYKTIRAVSDYCLCEDDAVIMLCDAVGLAGHNLSQSPSAYCARMSASRLGLTLYQGFGTYSAFRSVVHSLGLTLYLGFGTCFVFRSGVLKLRLTLYLGLGLALCSGSWS